ncbi:MAG: DUF5717 family protein [Candidatus Weimeria sp.]
MKEKIQRLANGEFERSFPKPLSDPAFIEKSGEEGRDIDGSLRIYTDSDMLLEGEIYSSNAYVTVEQSDFSGKDISLYFCAHTKGFCPGIKLDGHFTVITDGHNLTIPYSFTVTERYPQTGSGEIRELSDLYELEKNDRRTAISVFASDDFKRLLRRHFPEAYLSYRALTGTMGYTPLALESFLCENSLKDPIRLHVFPSDLNYYAVNEDVKETFRITRNTDGYVSLSFSVPDDSFVTLGMTQAGDDDFYGGTLEVPFFIKNDRIHPGVNTTKLVIKGNGILIEKEITVSTYGRDEKVYETSRERKRVICNALNGYLDFRLRKTDTDEFLKSATEACEYFLDKNPTDIFALLYRTMAQIVAGDKKDALVTIAMLKEMITDKKSFEWAFLLYLCSLLDSEEGYLDRITAEIEQIENELDDARVFWFLLFLKKDYSENPLKRLTDIRKWINRGHYSPILYAEALDVMNAYPQYIGQLDSFSLGILRFGQRNGVLSREIVPYISEFLYDMKDYSTAVFDFAGKLFDRYDDTALLSAIISYLLRNRRIGTEYAVWYKRGIELDLNLTGIYENYMYCLDESDTDMLPRLLLLYFSYDDSELSEEKRKYLYVNVIMYKDRQPDIYDSYRSQIERFAIEKLQQEDIDDYLSVIYRDLYKSNFFDQDLKEKLYVLKDALKVFCLSQESGQLSVYTRQLEKPYVTELHSHSAIISVGSDDFFTVLTNQNGIFSERELFYTEKLLPELSDEMADDSAAKVHITPDLEPSYSDSLIRSNAFEDICIDEIPGDLDLRGRDLPVVSFYIRTLIEKERLEQAFALMKDVYAFDVPENLLLHLATGMCRDASPDQFLTSLCTWLIAHYLSNTVTLEYLCRYYKAPTNELISVFKYANARGLDVSELSERILEQEMYEEGDYPETAEVFMSCRLVHPDQVLIKAVLTYFSDRYVLGKIKNPDEDFFKLIKDAYVSDKNINASVKTALLKHYAETGTLKPNELTVARELLTANVMNGTYFSFYKRMDIRLIREFGLYERVFIETKADFGQQLTAVLNPGEENEKILEMDEVYDGIYIASLVLFRGESAWYEIRNEKGERLDSGTVSNQDYPDGVVKSRFGLINEISEEEKAGDEALLESIKEYLRLDISSDDLFSMV